MAIIARRELFLSRAKGKYIPGYDADGSAVRYRSWDNLQYWFRGIEKYAPWVRKIHFITCGHYPKWLNLNHPKLNFVKHSDYLLAEYLPTFNSNPIEINLHRIKDLADKFVLFNDDFFIINKVKETDFFKNNLPCDQAIMNNFVPLGLFSYVDFNNMITINKHFNKKMAIKNNLLKWYNPVYLMRNFSNILFFPWKSFSRFVSSHLPTPYLKKTFQEVWEFEEQLLDKTSRNKFRTKEDVNHWLFRYWRLVKGEFCPSFVLGKKFDIFKNEKLNAQIYKAIVKQKYQIICVNEFEDDIDFNAEKQRLNRAFESIFPEKSSFEV